MDVVIPRRDEDEYHPPLTVEKMNVNELFAAAMSGILTTHHGRNDNARKAERAVAEMHRRLKETGQ